MNEMTLSENEIEALASFCLSECEKDTCPLERYDTLDDCHITYCKKSNRIQIPTIGGHNDSKKRRNIPEHPHGRTNHYTWIFFSLGTARIRKGWLYVPYQLETVSLALECNT